MNLVVNTVFCGTLSMSKEMFTVSRWAAWFHSDFFFMDLHLKRHEGLRQWDYIQIGFTGKHVQVTKLQQAKQHWKKKNAFRVSSQLYFRNTHRIEENPADITFQSNQHRWELESMSTKDCWISRSQIFKTMTDDVLDLNFFSIIKAIVWNDKLWEFYFQDSMATWLLN